MFNLRSSLSSCLTVVAFLVLAVLAARFYSGNNTANNNQGNTQINAQAKNIFTDIWSSAKVIASVNLIKNLGVGNASLEENIKKGIKSSTLVTADNPNTDSIVVSKDSDKTTGLNSYDIENSRPLVDLTAGALKSSSTDLANADLKELKNVDIKKEIDSIFSYKKTTDGAELIIKSKSGAEYKLPLPFKFLAQ